MSQDSLIVWIQKLCVTIAIALILYILYTLEMVVFSFLISGVLTLMLHGIIETGVKKRISPWLTLTIVYLVTFSIIGLIISSVLPIFLEYITKGVSSFTEWLGTLQNTFKDGGIKSLGLPNWIVFLIGKVQLEEAIEIIKTNAGAIQTFITNQVTNITNGSLSIIGNVGTAVTQTIFVAIMTFLMVLERKRVGHFLLDILPVKSARYVKKHFIDVQNILHAWFRGQLILAVCIFAISFIGLLIIETVFGVSSGKIWSLAMIAGMMEFIPYIGPIIALIPALVVGLGFSGEMGLTILIFYIIMQQVENNVLVPWVMSQSLNLSPLYVFLMMLAGGILGGVLGIILAVPTAAILRLVVQEYLRRKKSIDIEENIYTIEKVQTAPKTAK